MLKPIILAGVLAAAALPAMSVAQPDDPPNSYGDQGYNDGYNDNDYGQGGYGDHAPSQTYDDNGYGDRDEDQAPPPPSASYGDQRMYTGRVGASWWDQGRRCQWREVTWRDRDGDPAYKWVTVCDQ